MSRIVLASGSPRRRELLTQIGLTFEVMPAHGEEIITKTIPSEVVEELSEQKAREISESLNCESGQTLIVLGADTVVCQNGRIMGKPKDPEDAFEMIRSIQGSHHSVFTGVTILIFEPGKEVCTKVFSCETKVYVYPMTDEEINSYLETGEAMDKAGAYGIQGAFAAWIEKIEGDYFNVVGLPVSALWQEIKKYVSCD